MLDILKICKKHGELSIDKVYKSNDKNLKLGYTFKCKQCSYESAMKRPCKVHGILTIDDRTESGACRLCCLDNLYKLHLLNKKRNSNRPEFNEKIRLKKEADPGWSKATYKKMYYNQVKIHGNEVINERQKASKYGLSLIEYRKMFLDQDNKCAICHHPETRVFTPRDKSKPVRISKLCVDHCHKTNKIRQLLCHDCNSGIGKFKDSIGLLQSAIDYLKKHETVDIDKI